MKAKKGIIWLLGILLICGGGAVYAYTASAVPQNSGKKIKAEKRKIDQLMKETQAFYAERDYDLLAANTDTAHAEDLQAKYDEQEKRLTALKNSGVNGQDFDYLTSSCKAGETLLNDAKDKIEIQTAVNALFESDTKALNGPEIDQSLPLSSAADAATINKISEQAADKSAKFKKAVGKLLNVAKQGAPAAPASSSTEKSSGKTITDADTAALSIAKQLPQVGGAEGLTYLVQNSNGSYSFQYQAGSTANGTTINRVTISQKGQILEDVYLKTAAAQNTNTVSANEAANLAAEYHYQLNQPHANLAGTSSNGNGYDVQFIDPDTQISYWYHVSPNGNVSG